MTSCNSFFNIVDIFKFEDGLHPDFQSPTTFYNVQQ